ALFHGVLRGEALAQAYANMDVFAFPSHTDTFGNVVLEALACGVPAVVTDKGGPQFVVRNGETGFVARDPDQFVVKIMHLATNPEALTSMRIAARAAACHASWDVVFSSVYASYEQTLRTASVAGQVLRARPQPTVGY